MAGTVQHPYNRVIISTVLSSYVSLLIHTVSYIESAVLWASLHAFLETIMAFAM